jgi:hypothetical protein
MMIAVTSIGAVTIAANEEGINEVKKEGISSTTFCITTFVF